MPREYIITMTAENRVGILSAVTKAMADLGADLRETSQTVVRGYFTMIFSAEFPENIDRNIVVDHLQDACRPFGIDVNLKEPPPDSNDGSSPKAHKIRVIRLGGDNKPGVLRRLSGMISTRRVDIVGMHAVRTRGGDGFEMILKVALPIEIDTEQFLADINEAGRELSMTAELSGGG